MPIPLSNRPIAAPPRATPTAASSPTTTPAATQSSAPASTGWGPKPPARTLSEAMTAVYPMLAPDILKGRPADVRSIKFSSGMTDGKPDIFQVSIGDDGRPSVSQYDHASKAMGTSRASSEMERRLLSAMGMR